MFESCRPDLRKPLGNKGLSAFMDAARQDRQVLWGYDSPNSAGRDIPTKRPVTVEVAPRGAPSRERLPGVAKSHFLASFRQARPAVCLPCRCH